MQPLRGSQRNSFLRKSYHRRAFRRRDACALCEAKRLRRLPGYAAFTIPLGSQARRLRSLRSKAPSAVAWLRSVCPSSGVAGETPALFAEQSAFGGCRAAQRTLRRLPGCAAFALTSYLLPLTSYLLPFTFYLLPLTSYLLPHTSYLIPFTSYLIPHTSYLIPHTSYLLPLTSYLLFRFRSRRRRGLRGGRR